MASTNPERSERRSAQASDPAGTASSVAPSPSGNPTVNGSSMARSRPTLVLDNSGHEQQLSRVVELEIIPRLLMMHAQSGPAARAPGLVISDAHVKTLAELAVDEDANSASRFVQALAEAGATPNQILLELLAPCATLMGSWWCEDVFDFTEVTIGICRLQQALNEQAAHLRPALPSGAPRILLAAVPESQHTFGAALAAEYFAIAGWDVQYAPGLSWEALRCQLAYEHFDVLGLSLSCDAEVMSVASAIVGLRRVSTNQGLGVLVGGPLALACDDLATRCGADGQAAKVDAAVEWAQRWLDPTAGEGDFPGDG